MKRHYCLSSGTARSFAVLCSLLALGTSAVASPEKFDPADDHLIPVQYRFDAAYQKLVSSKLFVTSANLGRITVLPAHATEGETSIALYFTGSDSNQAMVSVMRAERNLWSARFGKDPRFTKAPLPRISRFDAAFPKSAAKRVSNAIKKAVRQTRELNNRNNVVVIDSTDIVFSLEQPEGRRLQGLLTPYAAGKNGTALRRLTKLLQEFCEAMSEKRPELLKQIEEQAGRLGG